MDERVKLRLSICSIEVSFEGSPLFAEKTLSGVIRDLVQLLREEDIGQFLKQSDGDVSGAPPRPHPQSTSWSTTTFAQKLNTQGGADLVLAAASKLMFVEKKESFSRRELLQEMQSATFYYRDTFSKNLSHYLRKLVREGKINSLNSDQYALSAEAYRELTNAIDKNKTTRDSPTQDNEA